MSLLRLKGKVLLTREEMTEAEGTYDLGSIAGSREWVWREVAIPIEEVKRIIAYDSSKSIVLTYDEEKTLVKEPFEEVYNKWFELREANPDLRGAHRDEAEEATEEEDEDD